jgi:putative endonuclease
LRGWRNPPGAGKLADLPATGGRTTSMISVYVITGERGFRYVGITANLSDRLKRHNRGATPSTKPYKPFRLIYEEKFPNYSDARKREKFFKSGAGRKFLDNLLS